MLDELYKTIIDNLIPDYIKIILQRCDESLVTKDDAEIESLMTASKYKLTELVENKQIGQWESYMIELKMSQDQRH